MTEAQIYDAIAEIMRDLFDSDDLVIGPQTTAQGVPGWDSQAHVMLILETEQRFGIRFRAAEFDQLHNVGEFVAAIQSKLGSRS